MCYHGLNQTSVELEEPFGCDWNDVDIEERNKHFHKILIDSLRLPAKPPYPENWPAGGGGFEQRIRKLFTRGLENVIDEENEHWSWDVLTLKRRHDVDREEAEDQTLEQRPAGDSVLSNPSPEEPSPNDVDLPASAEDLVEAEACAPSFEERPEDVDAGISEAMTIWEEESNQEEIAGNGTFAGILDAMHSKNAGVDCCKCTHLGTAVTLPEPVAGLTQTSHPEFREFSGELHETLVRLPSAPDTMTPAEAPDAFTTTEPKGAYNYT